MHQIPERVRLRPHAGCWTGHQRERLADALRRTAGVKSYRISACGHSVTVHHSAPLYAVISSVQQAVAQSTTATAGRADRGAPKDKRRERNRGAAHRLLVCAVVSLAIVLMPEPVAPAMILLRLLACGIAAAVRYQAEQHAEPCRLTRFLDALAFVIGIARAEHLLRALLKHFAETLLKRWAEARLQRALA